eukprot:scaffold4141_cov63-Phaeocystis_antarctica.AAC.4
MSSSKLTSPSPLESRKVMNIAAISSSSNAAANSSKLTDPLQSVSTPLNSCSSTSFEQPSSSS